MATPDPNSTMGKIDMANKSPYMFPADIEWTDKDCASMFNMEEANFSMWVLLQLISNIVNMDMGDPLAWFFPWKLAMYVFVFLNYPFSWSGLNLGRISMWTNGYVKNAANNMGKLIPCISQNMKKGAWSEWGA